jgi:hypothetical protein
MSSSQTFALFMPVKLESGMTISCQVEVNAGRFTEDEAAAVLS